MDKVVTEQMIEFLGKCTCMWSRGNPGVVNSICAALLQRNALLLENEKLRAEVREWICESCNTVYPGPPQKGFSCIICPKCGGSTSPRMRAENARLRAYQEKMLELKPLETISSLKADLEYFEAANGALMDSSNDCITELRGRLKTAEASLAKAEPVLAVAKRWTIGKTALLGFLIDSDRTLYEVITSVMKYEEEADHAKG